MSNRSGGALQRRHNDLDGVSNHQHLDCLLNRLLRRTSKKRQNSALLVFVKGIHRWQVDSPHKGPVTRTMLPFDDVTMWNDPKQAMSHHTRPSSLTPIRHHRNQCQHIVNWTLRFSLKKMPLKMSPAKERSFCLGLNVLRFKYRVSHKTVYPYYLAKLVNFNPFLIFFIFNKMRP